MNQLITGGPNIVVGKWHINGCMMVIYIYIHILIYEPTIRGF